jgi:hypothetical protein
MLSNPGSELGDNAKSSQLATHHRSSDHTACCRVPLNNANTSYRELANIETTKPSQGIRTIIWKRFWVRPLGNWKYQAGGHSLPA